MTLKEFKAWLEGYTEAGGKDLNVVREKLEKVEPPFVPAYPTIFPEKFLDYRDNKTVPNKNYA